MTSSPQKRRGSQFERDVVEVLRAHGHPHAERAMHFPDRGDIDGLPCFVIECKAHRSLDLAEWMEEALTEVNAAGDRGEVPPYPVVVAKRRGKSAERAYCIMELGDWAELVRKL